MHTGVKSTPFNVTHVVNAISNARILRDERDKSPLIYREGSAYIALVLVTHSTVKVRGCVATVVWQNRGFPGTAAKDKKGAPAAPLTIVKALEGGVVVTDLNCHWSSGQ
jgi:hypothetical protein